MNVKTKNKWLDIIRPGTVSLILGRKRRGKSALAYYLIDEACREYGLQPIIANLPIARSGLLPAHYKVMGFEEAIYQQRAAILIDEGTTMLPAGQKLDELVKATLSLSGQREQIVIFIYHASRDTGSKILRGLDAIIVKEPSHRQIEFGAKNDWFRHLLLQAKEEFSKIKNDRRCYAFVDSEDPSFQGMLTNPLPSFWSEELSKAWAEADLKNHRVKEPGPEELLETCLGSRRLTDQEYEKIWAPEYAEYHRQFVDIAEKLDLEFSGGLDIKGWIIRRLHAGRVCVMEATRPCPCPNPPALQCPLLHPRR